MDYRPYTWTNHALFHLCHADLACYGVSCAKDLGIRGLGTIRNLGLVIN